MDGVEQGGTQSRCARHPQTAALDTCARCGDFVCLDCLEAQDGKAYCPDCAPFTGYTLASLGRRFAGNMFDQLAFWVPVSVGAVLVDEGLPAWVILVPLLGVCAYNVFLIHEQGQTLGKLLVSTRMVTTDWERVPLWRVLLLRFPVTLLGLVGLGWIDAVFILGETRRTLHDFLAGTRVVEAELSRQLYD